MSAHPSRRALPADADVADTASNQSANASYRGYRTLWRWHFYAGLFVMPFLVILAITGTLYCFQPQIESLLYSHRFNVAPQTSPRLSADALLARAHTAVPAGSVASSVAVKTDPARSAEFVFRLPDAQMESVYLNPYTGEILGTLSVENRFMRIDRMLHRKLLLGRPGELLMELASCWTLVMIGTGVALWWPRKKTTARDALLPRLSLKGRPLWKNLHAVMGIWLALGALAFVLSGLPWSGFWGQQFKVLATRASLGDPAGAWGDLPLRSTRPGASSGALAASSADASVAGTSHHHEAAREAATGSRAVSNAMPGMVMDDLPIAQTPWAVGKVPVPDSQSASGDALSIARVIDIAAARGVTSGYDLVLPATPEGVFTVSWFPADPKAERTIYIDQYSGAVLRDIGYADYGAVSQVVSYGTALHMGRYFGVWNQIACAAISLGLAAMALTGVVMWWTRRPQRSIGAPSRERAAPPMRRWKAALILLGVVFPLMGATMVMVWVFDRFIVARASHRITS
ncbi:PepSY domain-containing protein [Paraburkholderia sp.]|uniref:PepSY-associated TM helix domain-containing protein n=1 Tax=Paraburkholderia sp. TaxID=1926495 RepID=UPI002396F907|nr:PepSY domain-containing protein [Paraburkholderia sp.]MDE1179913.1 PepSY domain-containing protein [Paraburkholderia sp.]